MADIVLGITLRGDGSNLVGQVKVSAEEMRKLGAAGDRAGKQAASGFDRMAGGLRAVRAGLAAAGLSIGINSIVSFTRSALDAAGGLGEMAQQLGIGTDALQALKFQAVSAGVTVGELQTGIAILTRTIGEAATGATQEAVDAFDRLGIKVTDAGGRIRSTEDVLSEVMVVLNDMSDPAERFAAAQDLMGRSATRLIPIIANGNKTLADFIAEAEAAGVVLSEEMIAKADAAADAWAELDFKLGIISQTLAVELAPAITAAVTELDKLITKGPDMDSFNRSLARTVELVRFLNPFAKSAESFLDAIGFGEPDTTGANAPGGGTFGFGGFAPTATTGGGGRPPRRTRTGEIEIIDAQVDSVTQLIAAMREEVELLGLSQRAREEELAVRAAQDLAMQEGNLLTREQAEAVRGLVQARQAAAIEEENQIARNELLRKGLEAEALAAAALADELKRQTDLFIDLGTEIGNLAFGFTELEDFGTFALRAIAAELKKLEFLGGPGGGLFSETGLIGGLIGEIFGGLSASAKGNVFEHGNVVPFRRGGVVTRPTIFPMARGAGLMAEAGPEAIMPLARTSGGELGVRASGGGVVVQIIDQRGRGARPEVTESQGPDGRKLVRVMIRDEVNAGIRNGEFDGALGQSFGVRRAGFSR